MANFENRAPVLQQEKEASIEQPLAFSVGDTVKVNSDTVDAALLWEVVQVEDSSGFCVARAIGDPEGALHAFRNDKVSAIADADLEHITLPKIKKLNEEELNLQVENAKRGAWIEEWIGAQPERSEAANEGAEDLGEQAVHEVVAEVEGDEEKPVATKEISPDELQTIEAGITKALSHASEVFRDKYKIDEELRGLLETLGRDVANIRSLATASSPQLFQQQAREFTERNLQETSRKFELFNRDSLSAIQNSVIEVSRRTKAAERSGEIYDDLKPATVDIQTPVTVAENVTQSIAFKLRKTHEELQQLINRSFRGSVEPSELMRIAAAYEEYDLSTHGMAHMLTELKRGVQTAAKVIANRNT